MSRNARILFFFSCDIEYTWSKNDFLYYILDSKKEEKECEVNFVLGEDSDDSEADTSLKHVETQTDMNALSYSPLQRIPSLSPPRSTEECLKILNSEVQFTSFMSDILVCCETLLKIFLYT